MYLDKLVLSNFRSFEQAEIPLCKGLTILVGENNGGKSNAIDAIRLLTAPLGGRRELYCETTDIRFGSAECQSASKRDPLSARKRDPLSGLRTVDVTRFLALRAA